MTTTEANNNRTINPLFTIDGESLMTMDEIIRQNPTVSDPAHLNTPDFADLLRLEIGGGIYKNNVWIERVR